MATYASYLASDGLQDMMKTMLLLNMKVTIGRLSDMQLAKCAFVLAPEFLPFFR